MNWNDYLKGFVLRVMTQPEMYKKDISVQTRLHYAIGLARKSWDAINKADLPESEKQIVVNDAGVFKALIQNANLGNDKLELIARLAIKKSNGVANWIAVDPQGGVWALEKKPYLSSKGTIRWQGSIDTEGISSWLIYFVDPPTDFTKEVYNINEILFPSMDE